MKKLFAFSLIALAALAVSCNKNEVQAPVNDGPKMRTVTCTIATPDTKVSINPANGKTQWEAGDEILFHGKYCGGDYSAVLTLTSDDISSDGKTFTATIPEFTNGAVQSKWEEYGSASNMFAIYPASAAAPGDAGTTNWYQQNKFAETNLPIMSGFNDGYDSNVFTFYNLCGIVSFIVTGDYDSYTLTSTGGEAVGYTGYASRIYKKSSDGTIKTDWVYAGTGTNTVSGTVTPGEETMVCIPGGVSLSEGFSILFFKSGTPKKTLTKTGEIEIARNAYRPMGNIESQLVDYVAPTSHESSIPTSGATALDAAGTANCYIVPVTTDGGGKVYTFKAYKGNSTSDVGTIASASIVWETYNTTDAVAENSVIAGVDFEKKDANLYYTMVFKMPATMHAGNAVIAAKDAGGNILWSWHIWVPANAVEAASYGGIMDSDLMDRNLGALVVAVAGADPVDVTSFGLLYQWGRKDPFPGVAATPSTPATVSKNATTKAEGTITLEEAIANPTLMGYTSNGDWIDVSDNTLWLNTGKTMYDPCPPGYRVPVRNGDKDFWSSDMSTKTGWAESTNGWFTLGDPVAVFPFAGYIDDDGLSYKHAGSRALYWTAHRSGDVTSYGADVRYGDRHKLSSPARARAGSVRCTTE